MSERQSSFISADDPPSPKHAKTGDKTMRFTLFWRHPDQSENAAVGETYEQMTTNPTQWSKDMIAWFNSTLRPHETKRVFVRCLIEGEVPPAAHRWMKLTVMTKSMSGGPRHGALYDAMKCERCGITGKRYGIGEFVKIDSKWRKVAYQRCDTSMIEQGKWKAQKAIA